MLTGRDTGSAQHLFGAEQPSPSRPRRRHRTRSHRSHAELNPDSRRLPPSWQRAHDAGFRDWWTFCTDGHFAAAAADGGREAWSAAQDFERAKWDSFPAQPYVDDGARSSRDTLIRGTGPVARLEPEPEREPEREPKPEPEPELQLQPTQPTQSLRSSREIVQPHAWGFASLPRRSRLELPPSIHKLESMTAARVTSARIDTSQHPQATFAHDIYVSPSVSSWQAQSLAPQAQPLAYPQPVASPRSRPDWPDSQHAPEHPMRTSAAAQPARNHVLEEHVSQGDELQIPSLQLSSHRNDPQAQPLAYPQPVASPRSRPDWPDSQHAPEHPMGSSAAAQPARNHALEEHVSQGDELQIPSLQLSSHRNDPQMPPSQLQSSELEDTQLAPPPPPTPPPAAAAGDLADSVEGEPVAPTDFKARFEQQFGRQYVPDPLSTQQQIQDAETKRRRKKNKKAATRTIYG